MKSHEYKVRIYYEDTDCAGVVYHANYLKFAERARSEWLRDQGFEQSKIKEEQGIVFPVYRLKIEYKKSAKLDDLLVITTEVVEVKKVRMKFLQKIFVENELYTELEVDVASVDLKGKPKSFEFPNEIN
jgi:acyl-CoA thioester hydrolase